jgi:hypothetical protein
LSALTLLATICGAATAYVRAESPLTAFDGALAGPQDQRIALSACSA